MNFAPPYDTVPESSTVKSYADMDELPPDFDFSKGERGKFYHENAVIHFPLYLDPEVLRFFSARAHEQQLNTQTLLNQILKREMTKSEAVGSTRRQSASQVNVSKAI